MLDDEASAQARAALAKASLHENVEALKSWFTPRRWLGKTQSAVTRQTFHAKDQAVDFAASHKVQTAVGGFALLTAIIGLFSLKKRRDRDVG